MTKEEAQAAIEELYSEYKDISLPELGEESLENTKNDLNSYFAAYCYLAAGVHFLAHEFGKCLVDLETMTKIAKQSGATDENLTSYVGPMGIMLAEVALELPREEFMGSISSDEIKAYESKMAKYEEKLNNEKF